MCCLLYVKTKSINYGKQIATNAEKIKRIKNQFKKSDEEDVSKKKSGGENTNRNRH